MNLINSRGFEQELDAWSRRDHIALAPVLPPREPEHEALIDVRHVRNLMRFLRNAVLRHRGTAMAVVAAFVVMGTLSVLLLPGSFYSETKLLADRNVVMPLLGNPSRRLPNEADTPTRLAAELILDHENLLKIVKSEKLLLEADRSLSMPARLKQGIRTLIAQPYSEQERLDQMVSTLRSRMNVYVGDGTVTIGATWNDPDVAYRVVTAAQQNFLKARQEQELALITGSITILNEAAGTLAVNIQRSLDSLSRQRRALTPAEARPFAGMQSVIRIDPALTVARSSLEESSRALSDLQQGRARRLQELQAKLAEQRNTYGSAHPEIQNTEQMMRAVMVEPPQMAELRADIERYRQQVEQLGGNTIITNNNDQAIAAAAIRSIEGLRSDSVVQERQTYGRSRLRIALASYQELLERLDAAQMELQTVQATFKFKYGVLIPASVPRSAASRKPMIVLAAALLGVIMAVFTAVTLDLARGRVLETWQIERSLGLRVLGEASLARLKA